MQSLSNVTSFTIYKDFRDKNSEVAEVNCLIHPRMDVKQAILNSVDETHAINCYAEVTYRDGTKYIYDPPLTDNTIK